MKRRIGSPANALMAGLLCMAVLLAVFLFFAGDQEIVRLYHKLCSLYHRRDELRVFVRSLGPAGVVGFIAVQILQIVVSPVPGEATGLLGGFLFGKWAGFVYSTVGLTAGSVLAFLISRRFRKFVVPWLRRSPAYGRFEKLLDHQGLFVCFFLFLMPGFPKDFLCYFLGLSRMPLLAFAVIAGVGRIPGTLMLSFQGAEIYNGNLVGLAALAAITVLVAAPAWYWRETIYAWVEQHEIEDDQE